MSNVQMVVHHDNSVAIDNGGVAINWFGLWLYSPLYLKKPGSRKCSSIFNNVASRTPPLNMTKIYESIVFANKPDIIISNESWLKNSIKKNFVNDNQHKVHQINRSEKTYPQNT